MIKSSSNNGIRIDKDIELVMKNTGTIPWWEYLFVYIILATICCSICFCFSTGLRIDISKPVVIGSIGIMVAYFMVLYYFQSIFKYTGIMTFFLYVMYGYIRLETLQAGYAGVYNAFVGMYNEYFDESMESLAISDSSYDKAEQYFLLFIMMIIVAIVCYVGMYGKTMFLYIIVTVPIVYLCFVVGYAPNLKPYIGYIIGTVALFAGTVCEKYGLFSKANRGTVGQFEVHTLERTRVRAQSISFLILALIFVVTYVAYSPERYETEFDAKQIRLDLQDKMKELTSGELLKDTIFHKFAEQFEGDSNSGMSNGKLGRVGKIKYENTTALKITTQRTNINRTLYLKGYIGERYTGESWKPLEDGEQQRIDDLNARLGYDGSEEELYQRLLNAYAGGLYPYLPMERLVMQVNNVSADKSCDYVPYNTMDSYQLLDGKVSISSIADGSYYVYDLGEKSGDSTYYERFFKYAKFSSLLQLNVLNTKIVERTINRDLSEFDPEQEGDLVNEILNSDITLPWSEIDKSVGVEDERTVGMIGTYLYDPFSKILDMIAYRNFANDEKEYFELVKDVYTRLPEHGLEKVKELVKDQKVAYHDASVDGEYVTMDQIDTTAYAKKLYENYRENTFMEAEQYCSEDFTYDELMNQDRMFEAISFVKDYLAQNTEYTLSPGKTASNKDYVEDFLFHKKRGYCMHYASAATVMLRAMGVPARYVEGYVVTDQDFKSANVIGSQSTIRIEDGSFREESRDLVEIDVKDTNAHAWVEVYLPGYGWTPIEMTAPYANGSTIEIPPVNMDPKATLKPTRKPTAKPANTKAPKVTATPLKQNPQPQTQMQKKSFLEGIQQWYDGLGIAIKKTIQLIVAAILLLVSAVAVIELRRRVLTAWYANRRDKMNRNQRILMEYREIVRLTKHQIEEYDTSASYEEYAKRFIETYPACSVQEAQVYFAILLKAKFGISLLSKEEEEIASKFYREFVTTLYAGMSKWKKQYYRYIFVLRM